MKNQKKDWEERFLQKLPNLKTDLKMMNFIRAEIEKAYLKGCQNSAKSKKT